MGDSADITAVKLENKKVYLQAGSSEAWVIVQAFPRERVAAFIASLGRKIAAIAGGMDPKRSEGTRTAEMWSEDYKLISESETEVSLREGSFGKLIRVKNENILREPARSDIFEEEGFETERTDDEEDFVTVLRKKRPARGKGVVSREGGASGTRVSGPDTLCGESTKRSEPRVCTDKRASDTPGMDQGHETHSQHFGVHIYEAFFFNRKRRVPRNWKLERAVTLAERGVRGRRLRSVTIRMPASAEKGAVRTDGPAAAHELGSAVHSEGPAPAVQNASQEGAVKETISAESADRRDDGAVQGGTASGSTAMEQTPGRSEAPRAHTTAAVHEGDTCHTEEDTDSFDAVTIRIPKIFSVFDVLFDQNSLSDELD